MLTIAQNTRYLWTSLIGCANPCNLATGVDAATGGAATDYGPLITSILSTATAASPVCLILDGAFAVSAIALPAAGNCSIIGLGFSTGFYKIAGTNSDVIHNGTPLTTSTFDVGPSVAAPSRGQNVYLANFYVNGNRGTISTGGTYNNDGNSSSGIAQGPGGDQFYCGINLDSLNHVRCRDLYLYNISTYAFRFNNCGDVVCDDCRVDAVAFNGTIPQNTDAFHVDGPGNDYKFTNCEANVGDDCIALNCPEGFTGSITGVQISNCKLSGFSGVRIYPNATVDSRVMNIDDVVIANCMMSATGGQSLILTGSGLVGSVSLSNCVLSSTLISQITTTLSLLSLSNVFFKGTAAANVLAIGTGGSVGSLKIDGLSVSGATGFELIDANPGTIGLLTIGSLDTTNLSGLLTSPSPANITAVAGAGVLSSGFALPDSVVAKWTPYLSSGSSLPSYKNAAGTVVSNWGGGTGGSSGTPYQGVGGTGDGTTTAFTLAYTPLANTLQVFDSEGRFMRPGSGNDYTLSGAVITWTTAPASGATFYVQFSH